jgi:hypothetical protein
MSRRPIAEVRVIRMPHLAAGCIRVEVECSASTTGLTHVPGVAFEMDTPMLITTAAFAHEERCAADCDLTAVHAKGDHRAREETERAYAAVQQRWQRSYVHGRRN